VLRLAEGEFAGKPFNLGPWQQFIIGSLFGWKGNDGYRRFRNAYIEVGKGNGKSPMGAGTGLIMLCLDGEMGAECYTVATTKEQADIPFQDAVKMVAASPALRQRLQNSGNVKTFNIAHLASGSYFRPLSAKHNSLDGKRVHYALVDELHEHPNSLVVDKMRAGTKGRRQALVVEITNSGFDRTSVCWNHHEYSRKVLEGILKDDSWFAYVCALDEDDDWKNEKVWAKANPNLGVSIPLRYLREQVREAIGMPIKQNLVKRLNFCMWTKAGEVWIPPEMWAACGAKFDEEQLIGQDCFPGLDLSKGRDFAALVLVFPGTPIRVLSYFWLPTESVTRLAEKANLPLLEWVEQGHLRLTPGGSLDFDFIRRDINHLASKFNFREIGYDEHQALQIATQLEGDGHTMVPVRQGFLTLTEPTEEVMSLVKSKGLQHNNHPIMNWMISNIMIAQDAAGNIKIDKKRSAEKVDGPAAMVNGISRLIRNPEEPYTDPEVMLL
jgi:phage terminase large subunit-like protein